MFTNQRMCSYARNLGTFQRKASRASAPYTRISLTARDREWWQQRGWAQTWVLRSRRQRVSSQGGSWGRAAWRRWAAWTLGSGSCAAVWRLENNLLRIVVTSRCKPAHADSRKARYELRQIFFKGGTIIVFAWSADAGIFAWKQDVHHSECTLIICGQSTTLIICQFSH